MTDHQDRLYELLPVIHRQRDAEQGYPLRALLQVIAEQVDVVEEDIRQLYENWFIETCQDWVVPYIGDLIGYRIVHEAGEPGEVATQQGRQRNKILIPRREVANTIRSRRRKGTLALLEQLANDAAGWPSRAVEFYQRLGWTQPLNHQRLDRGRTVDLRQGEALDLIDGPFDRLAHTVDVRRINSCYQSGSYNIPSVGLFVWRLKTYAVAETTYAVAETPACCLEDEGPHCYTFSVLGNDCPLYIKPEPETEPTHIAEELNLPAPIRRRAFAQNLGDYYGEKKSLAIWVSEWGNCDPMKPVPAEAIIPADLSNWHYRPQRGQLAVDPVLGRLMFPPGQLPKKNVRVSYHYGFSADIGGGKYERPLAQPAAFTLYQVGESETLTRINEALAQWMTDKPEHAVIEITDSGVYVEPIKFELPEGKSLQIRAAHRARPLIRLLDWQTALPDALTVTLHRASRLTLDGLLITGRGIHIHGAADENAGAAICAGEVAIRHCTLVPGWALHPNCDPKRPNEASLELHNVPARVNIEHSIIGAIQVNEDEVTTDPIPLRISDSIWDATDSANEVLGAPGCPVAHAMLTVLRSTVFGEIQVHAIKLAENSIFAGLIKVARRQIGCMRFCCLKPGSRTPRRYNCQPDLAEKAIAEKLRAEAVAGNHEIAAAQQRERDRVRPQFNSTRYGTPAYCQLSNTCAEEITRGADDESELGAFHDLFQPQREANLRARLDEYTPAGMEAGIIYAS